MFIFFFFPCHSHAHKHFCLHSPPNIHTGVCADKLTQGHTHTKQQKKKEGGKKKRKKKHALITGTHLHTETLVQLCSSIFQMHMYIFIYMYIYIYVQVVSHMKQWLQKFSPFVGRTEFLHYFSKKTILCFFFFFFQVLVFKLVQLPEQRAESLVQSAHLRDQLPKSLVDTFR